MESFWNLLDSKATCEHKFIFLRTTKWTDTTEQHNIYYNLVDTFICEKCLQRKEIKKSEYSYDVPEWYK